MRCLPSRVWNSATGLQGPGFADLRTMMRSAMMIKGTVRLKTNHSGGILGGISVGDAAPIVFACAVKPTPSIAKRRRP